MITKNDLRKKAKEIRNSLNVKEISEKIVANILKLETYKKANHIMLFYPLGSEVDLRSLLNDDKKHFYLPKVNGKELLACPYKIGDDLVISSFNTQEPTSIPINDTSILDIILVPALMVDKKLNRLGYGGGFYDRFLSKQSSSSLKIVAIPQALIIDEIPMDDFDEFVDLIITESTEIESASS